MKNKEELIINFLKKNKRASTSRIANAIKSDYWITAGYLESLFKKNKVIKQEETIGTYWEFKELSKEKGE